MEKLFSLNEFALAAVEKNLSFGDYALQMQAEELETSQEQIIVQMKSCISVMRSAVQKGLVGQKTRGGLGGGDAKKIADLRSQDKYINISGEILSDAIQSALAISEANAGMGKIVAAPTAGASGVIPGVFFAIAKPLVLGDEQLAKGLVTAGVIGLIIASRASLAGAVGGCQAECGSAAAMAAGATVDLAGGDPIAVTHAAAIALKNMLGLVCDPVAGLVEVPCIKRNAGAAAQALVAAQMALAGIESFIPADEVFDTMKAVGNSMPCALRETSDGGLAVTPTALEWSRKFSGQ